MSSVLDASALLALIRLEPGHERVAAALPTSHISTVNLSETLAKLVENGVDPAKATALLAKLECQVHEFGRGDAVAAGLLRARTRRAGLSFGDRACLALAGRLGLPALTADGPWATLDLDITVVLIR